MTYRLITHTPTDWADKTNMVSYAERQAQSCQYLERTLDSIEKRVTNLKPELSSDLSDLFGYLVWIHRRQYKDLEALTPIPQVDDRKSYYFDTLYAHFNLSPSALPNQINEDQLLAMLAVQAVSYMRGRDRYNVLKSYMDEKNNRFRDVWGKFFIDATGNTSKVVELMYKHFGTDNSDKAIKETLKAEDEMMKGIWRHKNVKA